MNERTQSVGESVGAVLALALCVALVTVPTAGQSQPSGTQSAAGQSSSSQPSTGDEGIESGNYRIHQSFEFGYRYVDSAGNADVYNTFANYHTGPRLLEQSLEVRSLNHQGALFDDLSMSSFGWGGDPNAATRLRISKFKWYNFAASFRYDRQSWDYNLFANPLNPVTSTPFIPIPISPHEFQTVRRIGDYDLTLFPQSRVRVRLGFNRTTSDGLSFWTIHEGTDTLLNQDWRTTQNVFRLGADFRLLPNTNISYDQFFGVFKNDTSWADGLFPFALSTGTPVDLGIVWNTLARSPCSTPFVGGFASSKCNGFLSYSRFAPMRTFVPTEQLSLQGTYWKKLDLSLRFNYTNSEMKNPLAPELFNGLDTRAAVRQDLWNGIATAQRIQGAFDFGATYHISDRFRLSDTFRWYNYHDPGFWTGTENTLFGGSLVVPPNTFNPAACPPPFTAVTCPQHSASSGPDINQMTFARFLGQETKQNTIEAEYDFNPRFGGHLGYRYGARYVHQWFLDASHQTFFPNLADDRGGCTDAGIPLAPDGSCIIDVLDSEDTAFPLTEHTGLIGFWARPTDAWRLNFDVELTSQSQREIDRDPSAAWAFVSSGVVGPTRLTPRNIQRYNFRGNYTPVRWATIGAAINIYEYRNNASEVHLLGHNRNYSVTTVLTPRDWFAFDFSYNYNDQKSNLDVCYVTNPFSPAAPLCPSLAPADATGFFGAFIQDIGFYDSAQHFGSVNVMVKPVKRVTANFGYSLTSVDGSQLLILGIPPAGPLRFNYHVPNAAIDVNLTDHVTWRTAWNYWGYNEKENLVPDPTFFPRDFHANMATVSLRYAF